MPASRERGVPRELVAGGLLPGGGRVSLVCWAVRGSACSRYIPGESDTAVVDRRERSNKKVKESNGREWTLPRERQAEGSGGLKTRR